MPSLDEDGALSARDQRRGGGSDRTHFIENVPLKSRTIEARNSLTGCADAFSKIAGTRPGEVRESFTGRMECPR